MRATKEDFEGIANTYIRKAMKGEPLPVTNEVDEDIVLESELTVFAFTFPVIMHFDPIVREDGNLILKQSSVEIGKANIPPSTVLKILKDSVNLPPWMIVRPKEEELFIDLSAIPVSGNLRVKAKDIQSWQMMKLFLKLLFRKNKEVKAMAEALATFAGGCFWCMVKPFDRYEGVLVRHFWLYGRRCGKPYV